MIKVLSLALAVILCGGVACHGLRHRDAGPTNLMLLHVTFCEEPLYGRMEVSEDGTANYFRSHHAWLWDKVSAEELQQVTDILTSADFAESVAEHREDARGVSINCALGEMLVLQTNIGNYRIRVNPETFEECPRGLWELIEAIDSLGVRHFELPPLLKTSDGGRSLTTICS